MSNVSEKDVLSSDDLDEMLEDLVDAKKILDNPELLKRLKSHADKKVKEISSVQDLRALSNEVSLSFSPLEKNANSEKKSNKKDKKKKVSSVQDLRDLGKEESED